MIDIVTGRPHQIGGDVFVLFTRAPEEAACELLRNRDPRRWRVETRPAGATTQF
ncbi:hypothetical protein ACFSM0_09245 [Rhodobacter lacus]|uniref:Uncharacterized protein n=1 Tax=Rhodobacter lacus TaxID=1641972 RepID=A0ABW5A7K8_9RHOB